MCTCCVTPNAGPRCQRWPITCQASGAWCWPGATSRRFGSRGCAAGRITEIGPADLALTREEAAVLLRDAQVQVGDDDLTGLHQRTEGWAAALYLAALSVREGGLLPGAAASFGGGDQFVSQYVESELLARISRRQREFLTRAAVLDRIS